MQAPHNFSVRTPRQRPAFGTCDGGIIRHQHNDVRRWVAKTTARKSASIVPRSTPRSQPIALTAAIAAAQHIPSITPCKVRGIERNVMRNSRGMRMKKLRREPDAPNASTQRYAERQHRRDRATATSRAGRQ
jgi:hypothetical protein